jgi:signal transduction histidine kinase
MDNLDHLLGRLDAPPELAAQVRATLAAQEAENRRLRAELQLLAGRRGEMLRRVIAAQDERCRRISRELHDEISQSLAAMAVDLETLQANGCITEDETLARLENLRERLLGALDEVHRIIADLRPAMLEDRGLLPAIQRYAAQRLSASATRLHTEAQGLPERLPPHLETTLYRIAQEAINNTAQHAGARNIWLNLARTETHFVLAVRDDGRGFDVQRVLLGGDAQTGMGLFGMCERASLAGGVCDIRSAPGAGATITVRLPIAAAEPAATATA